MKRALVVLILLAVTIPLIAQAPFEGIVESKNGTLDDMGEMQHYTMTLRLKGDKGRTDIAAFGSNPANLLIHRRDLGVVWVLDESKKTYFEMRMDGQEQAGKEMKGSGDSRLKKTGKKRKILGFPCEQLIFRNGDVQTEYWGTKKLISLTSMIARIFGEGESAEGISDALASLGYFPMIARTKLEGKVIEYSEVTKITRCALEDSLFVIPADYRKESAPEMP
jgi:hypothetical protein